MPKILVVSIAIVAVLVGGYFVARKNFIPKQAPQSTLKLTIATVEIPLPTFALAYIAKNKGYFQDEGLDITYARFPRGIDALNDVLKGNSDIGYAYETPAVRKIYEGEKLRIITTLHTSTNGTALIAREDRGILTVDDLKGKKIGVTKNSSFEFFLQSYLLSQGIKLSDVTFVDGEFADMAVLLKTGKADAVAIGSPYFYDIQKEYPESALSIFQSEVYTENGILAGREDIINNKKEAITRFLRALSKAEDFYKANNQGALNAVIVELPSFSEESIRGTWDKFIPELKLDNVLLTLLNREGQWFKDNGIYKTEVPNFRDAIAAGYLKEVKSEAVTIF